VVRESLALEFGGLAAVAFDSDRHPAERADHLQCVDAEASAATDDGDASTGAEVKSLGDDVVRRGDGVADDSGALQRDFVRDAYHVAAGQRDEAAR